MVRSSSVNFVFNLIHFPIRRTAMSTGKKLINRPDEAVDEALSGLVASRHNLALIDGRRVVVVSPPADVKGRLAVICGGGSGRPLY